MEISKSFAPIAREDAGVLILGSMPGAESLARQQYYAHPRNAFWPIMGHLFDAGLEWDYSQRIRRLIVNRIAVWDVLHSCHRLGSLDAKICRDSIRINNFIDFFARHPHIRQVYFNGKTAEAYFNKLVMPKLAAQPDIIESSCLPSTSPAFAALSLEQKLAFWKSIKIYLDKYGRSN